MLGEGDLDDDDVRGTPADDVSDAGSGDEDAGNSGAVDPTDSW